MTRDVTRRAWRKTADAIEILERASFDEIDEIDDAEAASAHAREARETMIAALGMRAVTVPPHVERMASISHTARLVLGAMLEITAGGACDGAIDVYEDEWAWSLDWALIERLHPALSPMSRELDELLAAGLIARVGERGVTVTRRAKG